MVLSRPEGASDRLKDFLVRLPVEGREPALLAAGFRRIRPETACGNFVYSRQLTEKLVRGASVILCTGEPPFVLLTNEAPGPWLAPGPGEAEVSAPSAPKAPPPLVASPQIGTITPTCDTDPCGTLDGKRVVLVGWLVNGSREALQSIQAVLRQEHWQVPAPWKVGNYYRLRIYTSGKSFTDAAELPTKLRAAAGDNVEFKPLTVPASASD